MDPGATSGGWVRSKDKRPTFFSRPLFPLQPEIVRLLLGCDSVLGCFSHAELYDSLGLDLNRFASLGIASHAGFAVGLHQSPQPRYYEHAILFCLLDGGVSQVFEKGNNRLVIGIQFLGHMADELGLSHA